MMRLFDQVRNFLSNDNDDQIDPGTNPYAVPPSRPHPHTPSQLSPDLSFLQHPALSSSRAQFADNYRRFTKRMLDSEALAVASNHHQRAILLNAILDYAIERRTTLGILSGPLDVFPPDMEAYAKIQHLTTEGHLALILVANRNCSPWRRIAELNPAIPVNHIASIEADRLQYLAVTGLSMYLSSAPRPVPEPQPHDCDPTRQIALSARADLRGQLDWLRHSFEDLRRSA